MLKRTTYIEEYEFMIDDERMKGALVFPNKLGEQLPSVIYVHGHMGSKESSRFNPVLSNPENYIWRWINSLGYAAVLPVVYGYGNDEQRRDYCGPKTIEFTHKLVEQLLKHERIDRGRISIYGLSRGANVAASLAAQLGEKLACVVLQSGNYDFREDITTCEVPARIATVEKEIGPIEKITQKMFKERSPILRANEFMAPTLLLHGDADTDISVEQSYAMSKELSRLDKEHELVIIPGATHMINGETRTVPINQFLKKYLS